MGSKTKELWKNPEYREHMSNAHKGKKLPEEQKKKISLSLIGNKRSLGYKHPKEFGERISKALVGRPGTWKGKKRSILCPLSLETRKRMSDGQSGEKGSNWRGGLKPINKKIRAGLEFRLWREAVFARDNWTCQKYGIRGGKLHPHHILNFAEYPELRFAIDNGITLSEKAHREFHKKYGAINNTLEQLNEYLHEK